MPLPLAVSRQILSLSYSGYPPEDIAQQLNLTPQRVTTALDKAVAASSDNHRAAIVREAELHKLEEMEGVFLPRSLTGDLKSAHLVLKLMERRAALIGLDQQPPPTSATFNLVTVLANMAPKEYTARSREAVDIEVS